MVIDVFAGKRFISFRIKECDYGLYGGIISDYQETCMESC